MRFHSSKERNPSWAGGVSGVSARIANAISVGPGVRGDDDRMDGELISVEGFANDDAAEGEAASGLATTGCDWTIVSTIPNKSQ